MIAIKLRKAMDLYRQRTGVRLTYETLSAVSGIAKPTLNNIGSRKNSYNATLALIEKLCAALETTPGELLEYIPDPPKPKRKKSKTKRRLQPRKPKSKSM